MQWQTNVPFSYSSLKAHICQGRTDTEIHGLNIISDELMLQVVQIL